MTTFVGSVIAIEIILFINSEWSERNRWVHQNIYVSFGLINFELIQDGGIQCSGATGKCESFKKNLNHF